MFNGNLPIARRLLKAFFFLLYFSFMMMIFFFFFITFRLTFFYPYFSFCFFVLFLLLLKKKNCCFSRIIQIFILCLMCEHKFTFNRQIYTNIQTFRELLNRSGVALEFNSFYFITMNICTMN